MSLNAIEITNLTVEYKKGFFQKTGRGVVELNLSVERGELFGFLGPNGAGKTTTIKVLTGLLKPSAGTISVLGNAISDKNTRQKIGYMPENPYFYEYLTAIETLQFYGALFGLNKKEVRAKTDILLSTVGLTDVEGVRVRDFSKGMRQRLGFAQALINDPEVVFLDEPLSGLDPIGRADLKACMRNLHKEGKTVFFSSHILPDVEDTCTQIGLINAGSLIQIGKIGEILERESKKIEVTVRSDADLLQIYADKEVEQRGDNIYSIRIGSQDESDAVVKELSGKNAEIISVIPVREDLESFFISRIKQVEGEGE